MIEETAMLGRGLLAGGALVALLAAFVLKEHGGTTLQLYEMLVWPIEGPEPLPKISEVQPQRAFGPLLFGAGMVALLAGLGTAWKRQGGKAAVAALVLLAGIGTAAAGGLTGWSLHSQKECFDVIASSPTIPDYDALTPRIEAAGETSNIGWWSLVGSQALLVVASAFFFKRQSGLDPRPLSKLAQIMLILVAMLAVAFAVLFIYGWMDLLATFAILGRSPTSPKPVELAAGIMLITQYLSWSSLVLFLCGLAEIVLGGLLFFKPHSTRSAA